MNQLNGNPGMRKKNNKKKTYGETTRKTIYLQNDGNKQRDNKAR